MNGWVKWVEMKERKMKEMQRKEKRVVRTLENCWPNLTQANLLIVP